MIKLKALKAFEDEDGKFKKDEEFLVNDERALVLTRTGKAERCEDQSQPGIAADGVALSLEDPVGTSVAEETPAPAGFGVPRAPATKAAAKTGQKTKK